MYRRHWRLRCLLVAVLFDQRNCTHFTCFYVFWDVSDSRFCAFLIQKSLYSGSTLLAISPMMTRVTTRHCSTRRCAISAALTTASDTRWRVLLCPSTSPRLNVAPTHRVSRFHSQPDCVLHAAGGCGNGGDDVTGTCYRREHDAGLEWRSATTNETQFVDIQSNSRCLSRHQRVFIAQLEMPRHVTVVQSVILWDIHSLRQALKPQM